MSNRVKLSIAILLAAAGVFLLVGGRGSRGKAPSMRAAHFADSGTASSGPGFQGSGLQPAVTGAGSASIPAIATESGKLPGETDIQNIVSIARNASLDEALASYEIYVNSIIAEGANNKDHLQKLLHATINLSYFDPANDHIGWLVPLYRKYPEQFKSALNDLNAPFDIRAGLLETVQSFSQSMAKAD